MKKVLSIFVDESGDFGRSDARSPYYIVTLVLHDQSKSIDENVRALDGHLNQLGYAEQAIHTGPLIRREAPYIDTDIKERRKLFNSLFQFTRKIPIEYISIVIAKKECADIIDMTTKLSRELVNALNQDLQYYRSFDEIIIYYDNGQLELGRILSSVFTAMFPHVSFRIVEPINYKLFQAADMICTIKLVETKVTNGSFSNSEKHFFNTGRDFKKNYCKSLLKKQK